jgi:hypothetical protein
MLELRVLGWSYSKLGRYFHKDHTTIIYHCVKWGIVPFKLPPPVPEIEFEDVVSYKKKKKEPRTFYKYSVLLDDEQDGPINPGKSYKQYLEDAKKQKHGAQWYRLFANGNRIAITRLTTHEENEGGEFDSGSLDLVQDEL